MDVSTATIDSEQKNRNSHRFVTSTFSYYFVGNLYREPKITENAFSGCMAKKSEGKSFRFCYGSDKNVHNL